MPYILKTLTTSETRDAVHDKRLSICLAADGFSYTEVSAQGELLAYGEATGSHSGIMTEATRDIKQFFAEMDIRPIGFRRMELIVCSDENVWVPDEVYTAASNRAYLRLVGGSGQTATAVPCRDIASTAVFAVDDTIVTAFKVALPGLTVANQHIRLVSCARLSGSHPLLIANWRNQRVDIAAFRDGRYLYGNTLTFSDENALAYQLVEVMRTFDMETPSTEMLMCGDVDRERFARFRPYFPKVTLFTGCCTMGPAFRTFHSYRHALLLI